MHNNSSIPSSPTIYSNSRYSFLEGVLIYITIVLSVFCYIGLSCYTCHRPLDTFDSLNDNNDHEQQDNQAQPVNTNHNTGGSYSGIYHDPTVLLGLEIESMTMQPSTHIAETQQAQGEVGNSTIGDTVAINLDTDHWT